MEHELTAFSTRTAQAETKMKKERVLVTSALPYANGPIHLGHLAGAYLPADVFVRFCRLKGRDVLYIGGTDEHGVPITIAADKSGQTPQQVVDHWHAHISDSFRRAGISFDHFSRTSRKIHHETSQDFFLRIHEQGLMTRKTETQLYCPSCARFLPDRYGEGVCHHCGAPGAKGDQCEVCGKPIDPLKLIGPVCKLCGGVPEPRDTWHYYFQLDRMQEKIKTWLETKGYWKENVLSFARGMLTEGLRERAVTRDMNWGIPVPLPDSEGKVLYVWFDAPIGYISSTREWAAERGTPELWKDYWQNPETRLVHFIGKDNIFFHVLMFPAMLMAYGKYVLPENVPANEYLNLEASSSRPAAILRSGCTTTWTASILTPCATTCAPTCRKPATWISTCASSRRTTTTSWRMPWATLSTARSRSWSGITGVRFRSGIRQAISTAPCSNAWQAWQHRSAN